MSISLAQIMNAGFENWTNGEPNNWHTNNVIGFPTAVTESSDANSGSSAVLIEVADLSGNPWIGAVVSGSDTWPFFDISEDYDEFTGYYKLHIEGGGQDDFGGILIEFYDAPWGQLVAMGVGELVPANTYTQFTVLMDYTVGNGNPAAATKISFTFGGQGEVGIGSWFLVDDLSLEGVTAVEELGNESIPNQFELKQNYPNPFNPSTKINFSVPEESFVSLKVYNVQGEEVAVLVNENLSSGNYNANWDASNLPSGVYVYMLRSENVQLSRKMILMK
jgi:hypothetical protein